MKCCVLAVTQVEIVNVSAQQLLHTQKNATEEESMSAGDLRSFVVCSSRTNSRDDRDYLLTVSLM